MDPGTSNERQVLLRYLTGQRGHVLEALEGLDANDLSRPVLPSRWTCLGLVNHLSLDVERFWFQAVIAGAQEAVDVLGSSSSAWEMGTVDSAAEVFQRYRSNIERADAIIATLSFDAPPAWWPDFFGSWRLNSVREIVLHVMTETAVHSGHVDAARELIDGKQYLVLTE